MDRTRRLLGSLLTLLLLLSAAGPAAAAESDISDILLVDTFITLFVYEGAADVSVSFGIDSTDQALVEEILDPDDLRDTAAETAGEFGVPDSAVTVGELLTDPYPSREVYLEGLDAAQVEGFLGDANDLFRFLSVQYVQGFWILTATLAPLSESSGDLVEDQVFANLWLQGPEGGRVQGDHDGEELDELLLAWEWDYDEPIDATATIEVPLASAATTDPAEEEETAAPTERSDDEPAEDPTDEPATGLQQDEEDRDRDADDDDERAAASADGGGVPPWVWILVGVVVLALVVALVVALTRGRSKSSGQGPWQGGPGGYGGPGGQPPGAPPYGQQGGYPPQQGGYPPQQGGYPPQQGGYPPQQGGYPPQQGGYPPQQGGYPPQQGGYPPPPGGYQG